MKIWKKHYQTILSQNHVIFISTSIDLCSTPDLSNELSKQITKGLEINGNNYSQYKVDRTVLLHPKPPATTSVGDP